VRRIGHHRPQLLGRDPGAAPHDWLQLTGGSIGLGIPLATGAAIACPDRKVVNLQADGSGLYTAQALWTRRAENLDVLTLIWANRSYAILKAELANVGANPGRKPWDMLSLSDPPVDWVASRAASGWRLGACPIWADWWPRAGRAGAARTLPGGGGDLSRGLRRGPSRPANVNVSLCSHALARFRPDPVAVWQQRLESPPASP
jgi:hypothetical protein